MYVHIYVAMCLCCMYRRIRKRNDPTKCLFVICPKQPVNQCKGTFAEANTLLDPEVLPGGTYVY